VSDHAPTVLAPSRAELAFADDVRAATVRGVRLATGVGATFIPLFNALDWLTAPAFAPRFLEIRLAVVVLHLACLFLSYREIGRRHIVIVGYVACLSATLSITVMQHMLDPGSSTYVAGLNLCLLAIAVLFPWEPRHTIAVNSIVVAGFLASAMIAWPVRDMALFSNNFFFLGATAVISALSGWANHREHRRRFDLSWSLDNRSHDLSRAIERLQENERLKTRFFANVSHELRTPLTLALSPLESLMAQPLPGPIRDNLRSLFVDLLALRRRIEDLIDLAQLDSGALQVSRAPQDLGRIVGTVLQAARPFAVRHGIDLGDAVQEGLPPVAGDGGKLEQIAFNLVSNALKFTPTGGRVQVGLHADGEHAVLSVSDTGPGISAEDQRDLFVRFGKSATTEVAKGSGLGLSIVKEYAELHGGGVSIESEPGHGATFTVRIPFGKADQRGAPASSGPSRLAEDFEAELLEREDRSLGEIPADDDGRPLVLVIDDNPRLRQFVRATLAEDFRVAEASDGGEGMDLVEKLQPSVVVCDMMMPRVDGGQFLAAVREMPAFRHLPVLLLTAHADATMRDDCLEMGASDFIAKPFSVRELRARVRNFAALRASELALGTTNAALARALEETRSAQARAVRAEKLAAIGQLSVGIAHEVKNPVNFVMNYARPARTRVERLRGEVLDLPNGDRVALDLGAIVEALTRVLEGGERIVGIVNGLQSFARGGDARLAVDVDAELAAVMRLAQATVPRGVDLRAEPGGAGKVLGSPVGLGAVLVNLLTNALKAVGPGGHVSVRTRGDDRQVIIEVEDDGCGMTPEVRARIFDPFFTTRPAGDGLGLGLALVHRIVHEDLGGSIDVETEAGQGTTFRVILPRSGATEVGAWSDISHPVSGLVS
jgi:signal transduction histidine kinase